MCEAAAVGTNVVDRKRVEWGRERKRPGGRTAEEKVGRARTLGLDFYRAGPSAPGQCYTSGVFCAYVRITTATAVLRFATVSHTYRVTIDETHGL